MRKLQYTYDAQERDTHFTNKRQDAQVRFTHFTKKGEGVQVRFTHLTRKGRTRKCALRREWVKEQIVSNWDPKQTLNESISSKCHPIRLLYI